MNTQNRTQVSNDEHCKCVRKQSKKENKFLKQNLIINKIGVEHY